MEVRFTYTARDDLRRLPYDVQKRIAKKMRFYAAQKDPLRFAKRLVDSREGEFRFRIGEYRVVFDVARDTIFVLKISKRDRAY